ncbi:MAG: DUF1049 domain-containing protein [Leptolyngbyaceae bacterium]|nr:DUF1049 domain-containing protein [Leptolyngbyaceae bacterium]
MRFLVSGVIAVTMGLWVVAIALLSIQNVLITDLAGNKTLVTLKFLGLMSVPLPFGLTLALSAALGMVGAAIALPLFSLAPKPRSGRSPRSPQRRP